MVSTLPAHNRLDPTGCPRHRRGARLGRRVVAQQGDVRDADAVDTVVRAGHDEFGRLDIAAAAAWLVSDAAKFITGTAWPLDAGLTIR